MQKVIHDINAYVEQDERYMCDKVVVTLEETKSGDAITKVVVEAYPADVDGNKLSGTSPLTVKDFGTDLDKAIEYYNSIEHQLSMGDIVHNV